MSRNHTSFLLAALALLAVGRAPARAQDTTGLTLYSIGDPSGDDTEILETIHRWRTDPAAEG